MTETSPVERKEGNVLPIIEKGRFVRLWTDAIGIPFADGALTETAEVGSELAVSDPAYKPQTIRDIRRLTHAEWYAKRNDPSDREIDPSSALYLVHLEEGGRLWVEALSFDSTWPQETGK